MKKRVSVMAIVSLLISLVAFVSFAVLLGGTNLYGFWVCSGIISFLFPFASKYVRRKLGLTGKGLEITAVIIGAFNCNFVLSYTTEINVFLIYIIIAVGCIIYATIFNNVLSANEIKQNEEVLRKAIVRERALQSEGCTEPFVPVHKWLCDGCQKMRTKTPCEHCGKE